MAAAQPETFDAVASGMRAFGAIALVLALLCVLAWLARRGTLRLPGPKGRAAIKVEGATSLGERRTLIVVTIEGRRLLLGGIDSARLVTPKGRAVAGGHV